MPRNRIKLEPRYEVDVSLKAWDIAKAGAGLRLAIRDRERLIGTIEIGQGTFGWKRASGKKGFKRIPWQQFAELVETC
jgi:hypothetical protein